MFMLEFKFFYRIFFLSLIFFFYILLFVPANAETYKLQCIYEEDVKKIITINEKNKKIRNLPVVWGPQWNYRNSGEYTYIYEVADFRKQMIIRFTIDLENLLEETVFLKVTEKNIEDIKMLKSKFDRGEITYDAIDQLKMKSFDQSFKNPKTTKNKVVKNWRNDWEGGHPEEYIMYENNSDLSYQFSMIHRCNFAN